MELYDDLLLAGCLVVLGAYVFIGGLVALHRKDKVITQEDHARYVVFWPYYLAERPVRAFWRHIRSPKPPNRTKV